MMRSYSTILLALLLLTGAAIWILSMEAPDHFLPRAAAEAPGQGGHVAHVEVVLAERRAIRPRTRQSGELRALREAHIHSRVSGQVKGDPAELGTRVEAGATLLTLHVPELEAAARTAEAGVGKASAALAQARAMESVARQEEARAQAYARQVAGGIESATFAIAEAAAEVEMATTVYERVAAVVAQSPQLIAQEDVDRARGGLEIARARSNGAKARLAEATEAAAVAKSSAAAAAAQVLAATSDVQAAAAGERLAKALLEEAQAMHGFATIKAPFAGVLVERDVDTGMLVRTGADPADALYRLLDDSQLRCRLFVADVDAQSIRPGSPAVLHVPGHESITTTVTRVAGGLDPSTRTMEVEIVLDNTSRRLHADSFVRAELFLKEIPDAWVLPAECVKTSKRRSHVLVVDAAGVVRKLAVVIGADDGAQIEIKEGLDGTEQVISKGAGLVAEGEKAVATRRAVKGAE